MLAAVIAAPPPVETLPPVARLSASGKRPAPGRMKVSFAAGLVRPEESARQALRQVADPRSPQYRKFPDRRLIATQYGATPEALQGLRQDAGRAGLKVTLDDTGVFATVSGTSRKMSKWLGRPVYLQSGRWKGLSARLLTSRGAAPASVRGFVSEFVGFDIHIRRSNAGASLAYSGRNDGTARSCLPRKAPKLNKYTYSYNQLRTAYGLDTLPNTVAAGRRTRVAIMGQGDGFSRRELRASAMCFGTHEMDFDRVGVPGLSAPLPVGDEGNLDVQVVQAVLPPRSQVDVIESASFDEREYLSFAVAYGRKHLPAVATTSYGYCEPDAKTLTKGVVPLTESVLLRLSLAGTTVFAASGDRGSSDCVNNTTGKGSKVESVDYPASSPYVVAVGGTRILLDRANKRVDEVVWNARKLARPMGPEKLAGGGGVSVMFDRPWWQDGVVTKKGRTLPDFSAHSAGGPGWPLIYKPESAATVGGTSAAAPFVAATVAVLAAVQGIPFGQLHPTIYAMPDSAFFDVVSGTNDLFQRGCCRARPGYDLASGRGAPRFDKWLQDLPDVN